MLTTLLLKTSESHHENKSEEIKLIFLLVSSFHPKIKNNAQYTGAKCGINNHFNTLIRTFFYEKQKIKQILQKRIVKEYGKFLKLGIF